MDSPKIIDYKVLRCASIDDLENRVSEWIKLGFQPFGGVSAVHLPSLGDRHIQAIVKYQTSTRAFTGPR